MKKIRAGHYERELENGVTILVLKENLYSRWFFRVVQRSLKYVIYESPLYETKEKCVNEARKFVYKTYEL